MEYLCHKWPRICSTCRKHFSVLSSFMTYHRVCNYIIMTGATSGAGTTHPSEHLSSPPVFRGVRIAWSFVLCVCFVDRCLSFCTFSYGHCVVCSSSVYIFWLPLWYLQALLKCQHDDLQVHTMPCFCFLHSITLKMYFQAR
jgi:hypothetical protein